MTGILVVAHGRLSEALLEATEMLVADNALVKAVTFLPGQGVEDLDSAVRTALQELSTNDGVLALVDLPGGSPARVVGTLVLEQYQMELVTGVNLPMLVEVLMMRKSMTLRELAEHAAASGAKGIVDVGKMLRTSP